MTRRFKRYSGSGLVGSLPAASEVRIVDFSVTGVALETTEQLEIGTRYAFHLGPPTDPIELSGRVQWSQLKATRPRGSADVEPIYYSGLELEGVFTDRARRVLRYVEEHSRMSPGERLLGRLEILASGDGGDPPADIVGFRLKQIGRRRLLVDAEPAVSVETRCRVALELDGEPFEALGRVVSVEARPNAEPSARHRMGIELLKASPKAIERMNRFLRRQIARRRRTTEPERASAEVRGNPDSEIYHRPGCRYYDSPSSSAAFPSAEEAEAAGYRAAKDCGG